MSNRFFENLPDMYYNNQLCKDISRRAKLVDDPKNSPFSFYPYTIKDQLRSDQIADYYFGDSDLDWLIYLSNDIIDPYYGWYLDDFKMEQLLIEKYSSIPNSLKKVYLYRNNWADDSNQITVSHYNNVIAQSWKKYYSPVFGPKLAILSYKRKEDDITMNTNRIIQYTIQANNGTIAFADNELVDFKYTGNSAAGTGEVISSNSTSVTIKNVYGNTTANTTATKYIVGETSGANVTSNGTITVYENFDVTEEVFWSPVTYYDYEVEINESKKDIKLIDTGLKDLLIQSFRNKVLDDIDPSTNLPLDS